MCKQEITTSKKKAISIFLLYLITVFAVLFFKKHTVDFELVGQIKVKDSIFHMERPTGFTVYRDKPDFYSAYAWDDRPEVQEQLDLVNIDFEKYDCLVTYGSEIVGIEYSWKFAYFESACPRSFLKKSTPVRVKYKGKQELKMIYFYKVPKHPKIRNICG